MMLLYCTGIIELYCQPEATVNCGGAGESFNTLQRGCPLLSFWGIQSRQTASPSHTQRRHQAIRSYNIVGRGIAWSVGD